MNRFAPIQLLLLLLGAATMAGCHPGQKADVWGETGSSEAKIAEIWLWNAPEEAAKAELFSAPAATMLEATQRIDAIRLDSNVKGLFLQVGGLGGAWARGADLRGSLNAFRKAGKPVHCQFESADNAGFALLASSCDRISMTPAGWLDLVGPAAQMFFAKSFLDKVGLSADFVRMGRYKSAIEPLTQDGMSPASREAMDALLDDVSDELVDAIATGRKLDAAKVRELINHGPFDADQALAAGLIDDVAFDDEARQHLRKAAKADKIRKMSLQEDDGRKGLAAVIRALSQRKEADVDEPHLAVVQVVGNIIDAEEDGDDARSGPFVRELRKLANDENVKAIVIRINSPGGSALASDRMWHAVRRAVKRKKPVIVSVGDMAASGGYYIASAGDEIYAEPLSIVGSIGVFGGKVTAAALADKLGVHFETLKRGDNAAWMSVTAPFTEAERNTLQNLIAQTYDRFVTRVAEGRKLTKAKVFAVAEGRVWTAKRGKDIGLVDHLGTLDDAVARARTLGKLGAEAPVTVWPRARTFFDGFDGDDDDEARIRAALSSRAMGGSLQAFLGPWKQAAMLAPLLGGKEHVLTAMPYVLEVR